MRDDDLIYGLKIRDPGICEEFYTRFAPTIFRVALAILNQEDLARDCTQDVLLRVLKSIHSFHRRSSLKTWVVAITVNTARTALRKKQRCEKNIYNQCHCISEMTRNSSIK